MRSKLTVLPLVVLSALLAQGCAATAARTTDLVAPANRTVAPALALPSADELRYGLEKREDERKSWQAQGLYVGAKASYSQILGDLDGDTAIVDSVSMPTEFVFLPDLDAAAGGGIEIANRWTVWEVALGYQVVEYDGSFGPATMDTEVTYIDLNFRRYFWVETPLQPFLLLGIGSSDAVIENGAADGMGVYDGKLDSGVNYNVGGGAAFFPLPWVSVWGQFLWRFGRYDQVEAPFDSSLVERSVDSDGWEMSGGVSFRVLRPRK